VLSICSVVRLPYVTPSPLPSELDELVLFIDKFSVFNPRDKASILRQRGHSVVQQGSCVPPDSVISLDKLSALNPRDKVSALIRRGLHTVVQQGSCVPLELLAHRPQERRQHRPPEEAQLHCNR